MRKALTSSNTSIILSLFLMTIILLLPILINPNLLISRNNDLSEFFIPYLYFVKVNLLKYHSLPLWNNSILSGTPLLPDPQAPIFYLPNITFLFMPIEKGYLFFFFLHIFLSGTFMYLLCRQGFNLSKTVSLITSLLYIINPKVSGYIEAGHVGLLTTFLWIPLTALSIIKIIETRKAIWVLSYGFFFSMLYYSHLITSFLLLISSVVFYLAFSLTKRKFLKTMLFFFIANLFFIGFISAQLLPQLEWKDETTRFILINNPDIYPKWLSKKEFVQSIFTPLSIKNNPGFDTEKWISVGITIIILFLIGLTKIKQFYRILLICVLLFIFFLFTNNIFPFPNIFNNNLFAIIRVLTRFWIISYLIILFVSAIGINVLYTKKQTPLLFILTILCIVELIVLNWSMFYKPITKKRNIVPNSFYTILKSDQEIFRVFCLDRCIPQKEAAINGIEIIDGYNTLQQKDYNQQMWQFTGNYWDYYSLSLPPFGVYLAGITKPDTKALGEYNTKYIISPRKLEGARLSLIMFSDNYYLYRNLDYLPRVYQRNNSKNSNSFILTNYQPNVLDLKINSQKENVIIANVYNSGWKAYLNGKQEVKIQKTPNNLQQVDIQNNTNNIRLIYQPTVFIIGIVITLVTYMLFIFFLLRHFYLQSRKSLK